MATSGPAPLTPRGLDSSWGQRGGGGDTWVRGRKGLGARTLGFHGESGGWNVDPPPPPSSLPRAEGRRGWRLHGPGLKKGGWGSDAGILREGPGRGRPGLREEGAGDWNPGPRGSLDAGPLLRQTSPAPAADPGLSGSPDNLPLLGSPLPLARLTLDPSEPRSPFPAPPPPLQPDVNPSAARGTSRASLSLEFP